MMRYNIVGKDTWRVLTLSGGHVHTYKLAPGEFADLSVTFIGQVFQVSKMHPNTQLYKEQHNQVDLFPVAFNQIQKSEFYLLHSTFCDTLMTSPL